VVELETDPFGHKITQARAVSLSVKSYASARSNFVLAAGGIENAPAPAAFESQVVERIGHGHWHGRADASWSIRATSRAAMVPCDPGWFARCSLYDVHETPLGTIMGRLALSEQVMRDERLLNASITLSAARDCPGRSSQTPRP